MANLRTKILDFRGVDSSIFLNLRGPILMSIGSFPESLSQAILAGIILVGRLGVTLSCHVARRSHRRERKRKGKGRGLAKQEGRENEMVEKGERKSQPSSTLDHGRREKRVSIAWHYLSNATCLIRPHLFSTALLVQYG